MVIGTKGREKKDFLMPSGKSEKKVEDGNQVESCYGCGRDVKVFSSSGRRRVYCHICEGGGGKESDFFHLCDGGEKPRGGHRGMRGHGL